MQIDRLLKQWIIKKPTPEEIEQAMDEYRELVGFCVQMRVLTTAPECLNKLIHWAQASQVVVLDHLLKGTDDEKDTIDIDR